MNVRYRSCDAELKPEDVNIEVAIAKCHACGIVFGFAAPTTGDEVGRMRDRPEVPMPERFSVTDVAGALTIVRRWFTLIAVFMVFFCLFWDGFMIVWFSIAISQGMWLMVAFGSLHGVIGVGLTYFTICLFLNRTTITVGQGRLRVRHGPLPWFGNHDLETMALDQLYTTEHVRRGKRGSFLTYTVNAALRDGKRLKLVKDLTEIGQALYIEQRIERHLGIEDRPMAGEVSR